MKILGLCILLSLSAGVSAERFGNWEYFIPEGSPFSLNPIDNGLYLQFSGQLTFNAQIVVTLNRDGEAYILHAIPNEETIALLPYRKIGHIQRPTYIGLLGNDEFLSSLEINEKSGFHSSEITIGMATITVNGLQSGADCGTANFFVFENSISNFELGGQYEVYESPGC